MEEFPEALGDADQLMDLCIGEERGIAGPLAVPGLIGEIIVTAGGIRAVLHDSVAGSPAQDNDALIEDPLGVGGEEDAGGIRLYHLLHHDAEPDGSGVDPVKPAVFQDGGSAGALKDLPDTGTDRCTLHIQEGPELSGEGAGRSVLQRSAGADGEETGIREMLCQMRPYLRL